jgi:hemolysin III
MSETTYQPTKGEEIANSITHGIGAGLSIAALVVLVVFASLYGDVWRIVSFSIYGACLTVLYTASTLYHSFRSQKLKKYFQIMDHASIYLLIAGTYTPFTLVHLRGGWGWSLFGVIWGLAVLGVIFKMFFTNRFNLLSTIIYLLMGWLIVIAFKPAVTHIPQGGLYWLLAGGLSYTFGVIFFLWEKLPYSHAIWHLFVLGGSICHFFAMLFYVLPM